MQFSKRSKALAQKIEPKAYSVEEAVAKVKETATASSRSPLTFPCGLASTRRRLDQLCVAPWRCHMDGREVRVLVLARPPRDEEAKAAGQIMRVWRSMSPRSRGMATSTSS